MIASEILIKGSINGVALRGALDDIGQAGIRGELGAGRGIGAPKANVPFVIGVPLWAGRGRNLFHFFARVSCTRVSESTPDAEEHQG